MIEKYPKDYEWWIGLQRHSENDTIWVWTDNTERNESASFIQWGSGEPNNYRDSEHCAEIWDNLLNDKNCDQPLQFICERPKDLPMKCDVDNGWDAVDSNNCYKFYSDKVTRSDATSTCNNDNAYMITSDDETSQKLITDFLDHEDKAKVWNGYQYDTSRSLWLNNHQQEASNKWWAEGIPDKDTDIHNGTLCSVIDTNAQGLKNWKSESCDDSNSVICWKRAGSCPPGYLKHKTTCYLLNTRDFTTWNEARGFCNLRSTKILEIKNDNDWYYILTLLKEHYSLTEIKSVWLGLSGMELDNLAWESGDTVGEFEKVKSNGKLDETKNYTKCAYIDRDKISSTGDGSSWQFGDCGESRGSICTIPVDTPVVTPPNGKPRYECPTGYTLNGIKCYRWYYDDPVDWFTARETCVREGADLVTIHSQDEQDFISTFIKSESWIGLNDRHKEGTFIWQDSSAQIEWQNWLKSQPNNVVIGKQFSENCVSMLYLPGKEEHGKWSDYPCSYKARFVCQMPAEWNIALGKIASQSSVRQETQYVYFNSYDYNDFSSDSDEVAEKAIDGCKTRSVKSSSCCARTDTEDNPWWTLDLGTVYSIGKIAIHRKSGKCPDCFKDFRLFISPTVKGTKVGKNMVYQEKREDIPYIIIIALKNVTFGRYVRIDIPRSSSQLELCEVEIFQGINLQRSLTPENSNCVVDSTKWTGDIRHTVTGKTCLKWDVKARLPPPFVITHRPIYAPTRLGEDAENFCRDPSGEGEPYCFTSIIEKTWEFCPVPHCITDLALPGLKADEDKMSDCPLGWDEDSSTGYCYWIGDEQLTWADANLVCETIGAWLPLPNMKKEIDLLSGKLSKEHDRTFWLNVYYDVNDNEWVSGKYSVPPFITEQVSQRNKPTTTMCVVSDKTGNFQIKSCLERNVYSCVKPGPFLKYQTSSDGKFIQLPDKFITTLQDGPVTTYQFKFEFKGYDGATVLLNQSLNVGYVIGIGGNISPKSTISKIDTNKVLKTVLIPNLCNENEFRGFWISWTNGNREGDTFLLGRGSTIGRNVFLQWPNEDGIGAATVSIAMVTKTTGDYQGFWRFGKDNIKTIKEKKKARASVNLALGKKTKQSGSYSYFSTSDKAVDGCKKNRYWSKCITHTNYDHEPWWEVDLGRNYPIREVVIYRRGPECCSERMGYFRVLVSMLSDSTLEQDVVYKSEDRAPPYTMNIPLKGKHGRYVKIDIPGRKGYLELAEVEVYEDIDASRCGAGWNEYGTECYKISDTKASWGVSKEYCEGFNAKMVVPTTPKQQFFLYVLSLPLYESRGVWLGLNDMDTEGNFVTSDGLQIVYTDWGQNEPNNLGSEDCVSLRMDLSAYSGRWNDKQCDTPLRVVCMKDETTTTTSTTTTTTVATTTTSTTMTTTRTMPVHITSPTQRGCLSGWLYNPISSICTKVFDEAKLTFYSAASRCLKHNARLASFEDYVDQALATMIFKQEMVDMSGAGKWDGYWVGGIDEHLEGKWQWFMTNTLLHPTLKWSEGQPDNYNGEDCAMVRINPKYFGELNDAPCETESKGYICQYSLDEKKCSDGWVYNGDTESCYKYVIEAPETWSVARDTCAARGATLATIASQSERLFLKALVSADLNIKGAWVGAHDIQEEGLFQWIDGTTWIDGLWAKAQPNNWKGKQNCGMLTVNALPDSLGLLQDDFCADKYPYICTIKSCKDGWEKFDNNCYLFSKENRAWEDAQAYCETAGANLVIVNSDKENKYLKHKVIESRFSYWWIGARYHPTFGEHRWVDGSKMSFTDWFPGLPGDKTGCVDYLKSFGYMWNTHTDCKRTKGPFICETGISMTESLNTPTPSATEHTTSSKTQKSTSSPFSTKTTSVGTILPPVTTTLAKTTYAGKCGIGWEKDPTLGTCYKFVIELATWTEAVDKCTEDGGSLVSITSDQEQSYITGRLQGLSVMPEAMWIGANDIDIEAGWKWKDGQPFAYLNWAQGAPSYYVNADDNDGTKVAEDCVVIITGNKHLFGKWDDISCSKKEGYICKKNVDEDDITTTKSPPSIEEIEVLEIYQKATYRADFQSVDLFEMGVRLTNTFRFAVKTRKDAHVKLQNKRTDFTNDVYLLIIAGWGGGKSVIASNDPKKSVEYLQHGLVSENDYTWFWITWNDRTIQVGKSEDVGKNVILTFNDKIKEINYVSIGTDWSTDAHWRIPKGDKYYGCPDKGWIGYRDSCYLVVEKVADWTEANAYCHKELAELASIEDENEQSFLFSQLPKGSYCFNKYNNDTKCDKWAEYGECERNPVWMATNCHLACKHCMHNCRDIYNSMKCLEWTKQGECARNAGWMLKNCAMSCGVCQGAPTRGYWLGMVSSGMDQSYKWADHSSVKYTNWNTHFPSWFSLQPRSCVAMFMQNGQWNDGQCTDPLQGFICKRSKMLLSITSQSPFKEGCTMENGYGYGVYCYVYVKEQRSWVDAQTYCASKGGRLAYVGDAYTQSFIDSELQNQLQDYWIGLSVTNGSWSWDGGYKLSMFHFNKNIKVNEITDGCFAMSTKKPVGLWNLYTNCSAALPSICQLPRPGFTTTPLPTTVTSTEPLPPCEDTWQQYGQHCYKVSTDKQRWRVAKDICSHYGASLVSIMDDDENLAISRMITDSTWIGLHDTDIEGVFVWEDGSETLYTAWNRGEPTNGDGNEDCVVFRKGQTNWNDVNCHILKPYICKIPRGKLVNKESYSNNKLQACDESKPEDGWKAFGEHCYYFFSRGALPWSTADFFCKTGNGFLASIHSEEENLFLSNGITEISWIGLHDTDVDSRFSWTDLSVVDYVSWGSGQPNGGVEGCVTLYLDGSWHDYPCSERKPFICKKLKPGVTTTIPTVPPTTREIIGGCREGFNYTFGDKCFSFIFDHETYRADAKDKCEMMQGRLASIHSQKENDFIALNMYQISTSVWLDLQDTNYDGLFEWSDNSRLDYTSWAPNEPSSDPHDTFYQEPCVEMWTSRNNLGFWNDVKCNVKRGYVCTATKDPSLPLPSVCPQGYIYLRQMCYKVIPTLQSWNQSLQSCSRDGGKMISVTSRKDVLLVNVLLDSSGLTEVWVGGILKDGKVQWNDGSTAFAVVQSLIRTGCIYSSKVLIQADPCSEARATICELDNSLSSTTSITSTTVQTTTTDTRSYQCQNSSWLLYNKNCYTPVFDLTSFPNTKCSEYGMSLISINSGEENYNIVKWILQRYTSDISRVHYPFFWIGLSLQTGDEPMDMWTDGSKVVYSNLDKSDNSRLQGCVYLMLFTSQWRVASCEDKHFYICKRPADVSLTPPNTTQEVNVIEPSIQTTTTKIHLPPFHQGQKMNKVADDTKLTGGQIAGVIIGVLGLLCIICAVVYIARSWTLKKPPYDYQSPSLGFDNALFHKSQDTVDIN